MTPTIKQRRAPQVCYASGVPVDEADAGVREKSADEMRAEFELARRRRQAQRGVAAPNDTDLPIQVPTRAESPPPK